MAMVELRPVAADAGSWSKVFDVMNAYAMSEALYTAVELDLFNIINRLGPMTLEEIAKEVGIGVGAGRVLLLGICATQLLVRDPETQKYRNSEAADGLLVDGAKNDLRAYVRFSAKIQRKGMLRLTESVREGRNEGLEFFPGAGTTLYERLRGDEELEKLFQDALSVYSEYLLKECLRVPDLRSVANLLDVGGGDGTTARHLCDAIPGLSVTVLETTTVCKIGQKRIAAAGFSDRVRFAEGDAFRSDWPAGHDGVFMAHFPEIFNLDSVKHLYENAARALSSGGKIFLWVAVADDNETGGPQAAKTSMYFLSTASGGGMTYPVSDHTKLLEGVGFKIANVYRIPELEHACIVAERN